jgi:hypothetical protein
VISRLATARSKLRALLSVDEQSVQTSKSQKAKGRSQVKIEMVLQAILLHGMTASLSNQRNVAPKGIFFEAVCFVVCMLTIGTGMLPNELLR